MQEICIFSANPSTETALDISSRHADNDSINKEKRGACLREDTALTESPKIARPRTQRAEPFQPIPPRAELYS